MRQLNLSATHRLARDVHERLEPLPVAADPEDVAALAPVVVPLASLSLAPGRVLRSSYARERWRGQLPIEGRRGARRPQAEGDLHKVQQDKARAGVERVGDADVRRRRGQL